MAWKPSGVTAPAPTSASVIAPCRTSAFAGVLPDSRQLPSRARIGKSRPKAYVVRAPVKIAAFIVVITETHTISATTTAPRSPATAPITSAAPALDSRAPPGPGRAGYAGGRTG